MTQILIKTMREKLYDLSKSFVYKQLRTNQRLTKAKWIGELIQLEDHLVVL